MPFIREIIVYNGPGGPFEGMAVRDATIEAEMPGVLLIPNVLGAKDADFDKAEEVAALGYTVLVADVYGQGKRATRRDEKPGRYMDELNADRALLRSRLAASLEALGTLPGCDPKRLAAIGFCFGGKCVLDMARAGLPIAGGVSFHGIYDRPPYANVQPISAKLLVCHGWEDPYTPPEAMFALATEFTEAGADWQVHAYSNTSHGFTDKAANLPKFGIMYAEAAERRSFKAMANFLAELFN